MDAFDGTVEEVQCHVVLALCRSLQEEGRMQKKTKEKERNGQKKERKRGRKRRKKVKVEETLGMSR
jgi:hypothetical protein